MRARRSFGRLAAGAAALVALVAALAPRGDEEVAVAPPPAAVERAAPQAVPPPPAQPPAPAAAPVAAPAVEAAASGALDADELRERLRAEVDVRPEVAIRLADEGDARFPDDPYADERQYVRMRALVHLGDIVAARDAAERFFVRHPRSALGRDVFRLTGMRPRPSPLPPEAMSAPSGG